MKLWWDPLRLMATATHGDAVWVSVSYLDTLRDSGFPRAQPEFRPAPLEQLAAEYYRAWQWLLERLQGRPAPPLAVRLRPRQLLDRISIDREWQQTTGALGKLADATCG